MDEDVTWCVILWGLICVGHVMERGEIHVRHQRQGDLRGRCDSVRSTADLA
jgi:hypothetical protein